MYPKNTAGHRMVKDIPIARTDQSLSEVRAMIEHHAAKFNTINYVYVTDDQKKLIGVLSLRNLFLHPGNALAGNVCKNTSLVTIKPDAHQERAAYLALKNNIKAIPVVDEKHRLLGEVGNDAIMSILYTEMHEDVLRMAGIGHAGGLQSNVLELPLLTSIRHRLPWLLIGLAGGLLAAKIIGLFEATLEANLMLAAFIPLIVYMSSAVGTQMEAYIIRDVALDHVVSFGRYLFRHFLIVAAMSVLLAVLLSLISIFLYGQPRIGLVLGVSLFISVLSSVVTGLIIPYLFSKLRMDPADASGPIATIAQDTISILIYFGVANALL